MGATLYQKLQQTRPKLFDPNMTFHSNYTFERDHLGESNVGGRKGGAAGFGTSDCNWTSLMSFHPSSSGSCGVVLQVVPYSCHHKDIWLFSRRVLESKSAA
jgi:hypothetical protein